MAETEYSVSGLLYIGKNVPKSKYENRIRKKKQKKKKKPEKNVIKNKTGLSTRVKFFFQEPSLPTK